jgi:hypothetical protein
VRTHCETHVDGASENGTSGRYSLAQRTRTDEREHPREQGAELPATPAIDHSASSLHGVP